MTFDLELWTHEHRTEILFWGIVLLFVFVKAFRDLLTGSLASMTRALVIWAAKGFVAFAVDFGSMIRWLITWAADFGAVHARRKKLLAAFRPYAKTDQPTPLEAERRARKAFPALAGFLAWEGVKLMGYAVDRTGRRLTLEADAGVHIDEEAFAVELCRAGCDVPLVNLAVAREQFGNASHVVISVKDKHERERFTRGPVLADFQPEATPLPYPDPQPKPAMQPPKKVAKRTPATTQPVATRTYVETVAQPLATTLATETVADLGDPYLNAIRAMGDATAEQVGNALGKTRQGAAKALNRHVARGVLTRTETGYALPQAEGVTE